MAFCMSLSHLIHLSVIASCVKMFVSLHFNYSCTVEEFNISLAFCSITMKLYILSYCHYNTQHVD